ncbi:MAG: peptidoglycan DD-metalloendopeptidase family protein [Halioglobus sp.]|nr:peptidoglycan DD-metalloendopeptidase family protein [Halioglobus sp.]
MRALYPGQHIRLQEAALAPLPVVAPLDIDPGTVSPVAPVTAIKPLPPEPVPVAGRPARPSTPDQEVPNVAAAPPVAPPKGAGGPVTAWLWPAEGPVTRSFSGSLHKGIDIGGTRGDPVVAVAAGTVVYAGTGIVGLGELLIVKHNAEYLSAYGHNDELLVAEGDTVRPGQTIARKGSSGTDTVKLHFEIREAGQPIDPQRLLPRR